MPGSSGSGASAIRIRYSRSRRRAVISAAVFLRGNSPKYSSMYWISSAPVSSGYCLIRYSIKIRSIVPQVGPHPALDLLDGHAFAGGVALDLIAADAADREVPGAGVGEIEPAHRRRGHHRGALGQRNPGPRRLQQVEQLVFFAVIRAGGIAKRRTDAAVAFGDQVVVGQLLAGAIAPV